MFIGDVPRSIPLAKLEIRGFARIRQPLSEPVNQAGTMLRGINEKGRGKKMWADCLRFPEAISPGNYLVAVVSVDFVFLLFFDFMAFLEVSVVS
jgi:hypothetical protein